MPPRRRSTLSAGNRRLSASVEARRKFVLEVKTRRSTASRERRAVVTRWVWLILFWGLFVSALAVSTQTVLEKFFFNNSDYNLTHLDTDTKGCLTDEEVRRITGLRPGINLFRIDLRVAENFLQEVPEVVEAKLTRILPDTLRVELKVREPVAWISTTDGEPGPPHQLVDASGHIYTPHRVLSEQYLLPVILGVRSRDLEAGDILHRQDLREALALLQCLRFSPDPVMEIRSVDISKGYCLETIDADNTCVLFDIGNYPAQFERLRKLLDHCRESGRQLEMVNLIPKRNTPVRFVLAGAPPPAQSN